MSTAGQDAAEFGELVGVWLDPWQRAVLDAAGAERADGSRASKTVDVLASRQNGKNAAVEVWELYCAVVLGEGVLHTAHEFKTALKAHKRIDKLIKAHPDVAAEVTGRWATPAQGYIFEFRKGGAIEFVARSGGSGRGFTIDVLILDEAQALSDEHLEALLPSVSARSVEGDPQFWHLGSAPSETQIVWQRRRKLWRSGGLPTMAAFEFSADPEADPDDRDAWAQANPGLGLHISEEHIEVERGSMSEEGFKKERLSISPEIDGEDSSLPGWAGCKLSGSEIVGPLALAVDVTPDRKWTSIAASGRNRHGAYHLEAIERLPGTSVAVARVAELVARHNAVAVALDPAGPAGSLLADLEQAGITVTSVSAREHGQACGALYDDVVNEAVAHLDDPLLNAAVYGAKRRALGDLWAWDRKRSDVDISPLVAVTLARWAFAATSTPAAPGFVDLSDFLDDDD